jgi:hypothetical protein
MATVTDIKFLLKPGQWFEFIPITGEISSDLKGPYKVLLKKTDRSRQHAQMYSIFTLQMNVLEYYPGKSEIGWKKIPDCTSIRILEAGQVVKLEGTQGVLEVTRHFLKALAELDNCLVYDPDNGQEVTSEALREKFHHQ